jgi:protein-disulfide isomerase
MALLTPPLGAGDHVLGNPNAPVNLVEFGDYECPFCRRAQAVVHAVLDRLDDRLLFGFRHFPITPAHPHALTAAVAAEAAGAQGQFWPMHELLFENQDALELDDIMDYAAALDLDLVRFAGDLRSEAILDKVRGDFASGVRSGVEGTPTFFIDGVQFAGDWDVESLTAALERARASRTEPSPAPTA